MKTAIDMYCQYLLSTQVNYTCTYFADHLQGLSHDSVHRFLRDEKLTPRLLWEKVSPHLTQSSRAFVIFDDTVLDKRHSQAIGMVRRQYSGNAHGIIKGIGVVNCLYLDPINQQFWLLDLRVFDPQTDGKTKLDHVLDMLRSLKARQVLFQTVLMDSWYATTDLMKYLMKEGKTFYCPIKSNRKVDDTSGQEPYKPVDELPWSEQEVEQGKLVKLHKFPLDVKVKLFRVEVSTHRTDYIVTNDVAQNATQAVKETCGLRWCVEQLHREEKQLTGIERSQCRLARAQRNHILAATLVWTRLKSLAYAYELTIYQLKKGLLDQYMNQQLVNPAICYA
ncbi:IS701 family transposase [Pontibacter pamirensis]|uniref:IS701 family transposase n=1 Tax=Pontibacter pamirensis TaxID=2562824 RepID=UPI00138A630E|nr:transposase [Pontibacter pamirensis]